MDLAQQTPPCPEGNLYSIRRGDTFCTIARRFRISLAELEEANPGVDPDRLAPGQIICIPLAVPPVRCPAGTTIYTIRSGDTLYALALRFNIPLGALIRANPGVHPSTLLIGQQICVPAAPQPSVCPQGTIVYGIRPGDTFTALARRFGTTVDAIRAANPNVNPDNLQPGQLVCVPRETGAPVQPGPHVPVPGPDLKTTPDPEQRRCPLGTEAYTVKEGDNLYSIAQSHRTTVADIISVNPGLSPDLIEVGQVICIPVEPA